MSNDRNTNRTPNDKARKQDKSQVRSRSNKRLGKTGSDRKKISARPDDDKKTYTLNAIKSADEF